MRARQQFRRSSRQIPLRGLRSGVWTEELFIKAMRTGKHMGTAPAITNHVPDPIPPAESLEEK